MKGGGDDGKSEAVRESDRLILKEAGEK